jgi:AraC-like DNA-binding protein
VSERLNKGRAFDVLGDVLETLRFRGSIFFRSELAAPWGMSLAKDGAPRFHIMLSGECFVGAKGHESINARATDVIMLPNGSSHWIADQPGRKMIPSTRAGKACELGNPLFQQGKITNRLMCGTVRFDEGVSHPLIETLPDVMHFPLVETEGSIWSVITLIDTEMQNCQGSGSRIADRLTEVLFLQLLNHHVRNNDNATGFLAALRDKRVYRALTLIHREPAFDWSLSLLGEQVGMSRATLVRRFQEVVGVAPMAYITSWRIMKAHKLVRSSATPLEKIAEATGFSSARTLSRTFKRHYGCTPNELRRSKHDL